MKSVILGLVLALVALGQADVSSGAFDRRESLKKLFGGTTFEQA